MAGAAAVICCTPSPAGDVQLWQFSTNPPENRTNAPQGPRKKRSIILDKYMIYDRICIAPARRTGHVTFCQNQVFADFLQFYGDWQHRTAFLEVFGPDKLPTIAWKFPQHSTSIDVDEQGMRTIALVEDDPSMMQGLSRLLSAHGFRVDGFTSAESFLDSLTHCEAACLVVDIHLGGISGIDLKRKLIASGNDFPVIFMTAVDNAVTRQQAADAGCIAYLRKPFLAKLLIEAINQVG
jgi:CheY-like chemotaxis protein